MGVGLEKQIMNDNKIYVTIVKWENRDTSEEWKKFLLLKGGNGMGYYEDREVDWPFSPYIAHTVLAASEELAEQAASVARASGAFSIIRCEGEVEYP